MILTSDVYRDNHNNKGDFLSQSYLGSTPVTFIHSGWLFFRLTISSSQTESLPLLLTIQVELLACGQVKTPLLAGRQSGPLGTCSGEVVFVSWGREAPRGLAW